ncbi:hypothetical protein HaLaN_04609, partial [Haematococcus lacustris]
MPPRGRVGLQSRRTTWPGERWCKWSGVATMFVGASPTVNCSLIDLELRCSTSTHQKHTFAGSAHVVATWWVARPRATNLHGH